MYYDTKYSSLSNLNRKEKRIIQSKFPFDIPSSDFDSSDICGQRMDQADISQITKFCPLCDSPMIVRMIILPCNHVVCYSCSQPDSEFCYVCNGKSTSVKRLADKTKLFECDFPDCFKMYESYEVLIQHKITHGISYIGMNMIGGR